MSFVQKVSLDAYDFLIPFTVGAIDGLARKVSPLTSGIRFASLHAIVALAARAFQHFVVQPVADALELKLSTKMALRTFTDATAGAFIFTTAVAIGCISKVAALILGALAIKSIISDLTDAYRLRVKNL